MSQSGSVLKRRQSKRKLDNESLKLMSSSLSRRSLD